MTDINSDNKLVNLSFLLLSKIISHLDENIDRICLTLTCKSLFQQTNKYINLKFNNKDQIIGKDFYLNHHFRERFSFEEDKAKETFFNIKDHSIPKYEEVPKTPFDTFSILNTLKGTKQTTEQLFNLLEQFPDVKKVIFSSDLCLMNPQCLSQFQIPHHFKEIKSFASSILKCKLPESLEILEITNFALIPPGALPKTLKSLKFQFSIGIDFKLKTGVLPMNLEHLVLSPTLEVEDESVSPLAPSLITLETDGRWLKYIKPLSCLKSLKCTIFLPDAFKSNLSIVKKPQPFGSFTGFNAPLNEPKQCILPSFGPGNIPIPNSASTKNAPIVLSPEMLPSSLEYLHLIFENGYTPTTDIIKLPKGLKKLKIEIDYCVVGLIPDDVEELELVLRFGELLPGFIPKSVRKFFISDYTPSFNEPRIDLNFKNGQLDFGKLENVTDLKISLPFLRNTKITSLSSSINSITIQQLTNWNTVFFKKYNYRRLSNDSFLLVSDIGEAVNAGILPTKSIQDSIGILLRYK